jgi:hypothetical protein
MAAAHRARENRVHPIAPAQRKLRTDRSRFLQARATHRPPTEWKERP